MTAAPRARAKRPAAWRLLAAPIAPCELLPAGRAGALWIDGAEYALSYHGALPERGGARIDGYRLAKADGTTYDLPAGLGGCECLGHLRWGHCKHHRALSGLKADGEIV